MADDKMEIAVRDPKPVAQALKKAMTAENFQKYILGTKKNGAPRAVYDIIKDVAIDPKKKKKKKGKKKSKVQPGMYDLYLGVHGKKKKKKHKGKHWKYNG